MRKRVARRQRNASDRVGARGGAKLYALRVIARVCLLWALRQMTGSSAEVLAVANEVLAVDR